MKAQYAVRWYARNGTIREVYFDRLREAREEAKRHKDAEIYRREMPRGRSAVCL